MVLKTTLLVFLVSMARCLCYAAATGMIFNREGSYKHAFFTVVGKDRELNRSDLLLFANTARDFLECCLHCLSNQQCWSVNYKPVDETREVCQGFGWDSGIYQPRLAKNNGSFYARIKTPCDDSPCLNAATCQPLSKEPLYKCDCGQRYGGKRCQVDCVIFDFEQGITGWNETGTAFKWQPTYGDNPTARNRGQPSNHSGDWWIGTAESRSEPTKPAGMGSFQGDGPTGTLTSPSFTIFGNTLSFLIGGGCDINFEFVELVVEGSSVAKATGKCDETMETQTWNVTSFRGQMAWVRLFDGGSGGWGHINFDHLVDTFCEESTE